MSVVIDELKDIITNNKSIKVLATTGNDGIPHVVVKSHIYIEDNYIILLELLEGSRTNKNLTYSLWYEKTVAINVVTNDGRSFEICGVPKKCIVGGSIFEKYYSLVLKEDRNNDLSSVYYIEIQSIHNETYSVKRDEHSTAHPLYLHIDKIAKDI